MKNDDLISRAAAIDALTDQNIARNFDNVCDGEIHQTKRAAIRIIANLPAVDAAPVVHARWIDYKDEHQCSKCREFTIVDFYVWKNMPFDYCPNCGANMDGGPDA